MGGEIGFDDISFLCLGDNFGHFEFDGIRAEVSDGNGGVRCDLVLYLLEAMNQL